MKSSHRHRFSSSAATTVVYTFQNDNSAPEPDSKIAEIPIASAPNGTVHQSLDSSAATKIQAAYRSHVETVDAVRSSARERMKINEALMGLLFRLDSVPGVDPNVRELRRHVSRKIVGLQEILDAVSDTRVEHWDGYLRDWDDIVAGLEQEVCKERGGGKEMEMFCAQHLGFQCLQRFLRDQ
ncbi:hypothetical protein C2S52_007279 [Perilla frutescens var. hirtella]|nr:hypothetical protein C2S51_014171 [Perilla frutescens var. frutescens]KAH6787727.1 hypothetical protein C2S52_007279 [Perilla frutescens var. hirtella]